MLAWIALLLLIVAEAVAIRWWLVAQFRSLFFNDWAAFLYSVLLAVDIAIGWFISTFNQPGGTTAMQILLVTGVALALIVGLGTLFFRWVIHLDMSDMSKRDK